MNGRDASLFEERAFVARNEAIDFIELHTPDDGADLKARLEQVDLLLFERLRQDLRSGLRGEALLQCIRSFVPPMHTPDGRYDHLDTFMTGLLLHHPLPQESRPRDKEMVFYQRTPSRITLELIERARLSAADVFYDVGSGLGEVTILANLLTDATTKGVEYDSSYCEYARQLTRDLRLTNIEFLNADARNIDFSDGTTFFLYTPFAGGMLRDFLDHLQSSSGGRTIRVYTYGPCTFEVPAHGWLQCVEAESLRHDRLAEFTNTR